VELVLARFAAGAARADRQRLGRAWFGRQQCGNAGRPCRRPRRRRAGPPQQLARGVALTPTERHRLNRLMVFFALVYVVEGLGQTGGLIAQPLNYFLKETYGWTPVQVTAHLTVLNFPWIITPVYGIVSDFVPQLGHRRKAYL